MLKYIICSTKLAGCCYILCQEDMMQCGFVPMGILLRTITEAGTGTHILLFGICYGKRFGHMLYFPVFFFFFQEQSYAQNRKEESSTIENSSILFYANKMTSKLKPV